VIQEDAMWKKIVQMLLRFTASDDQEIEEVVFSLTEKPIF
jgi:hypothetical protein